MAMIGNGSSGVQILPALQPGEQSDSVLIKPMVITTWSGQRNGAFYSVTDMDCSSSAADLDNRKDCRSSPKRRNGRR